MRDALLAALLLGAASMSAFRPERAGRKPYSRPASRGDPDAQWLHDKAPSAPRADLNPRPRAPAAPAAPNSRLLVANLHYEVTPKDLTAIFAQIGTLVRPPTLRYDRSGRSSGVAVIAYEHAADAARARAQYDGILARGQPMAITFEAPPPRAPRRAVSAPTSLLARIQKPPLLARISTDDAALPPPAGPRAGAGPVRARAPRGAKAPARAGPKAPKVPKTAADLDAELDTFMGDSTPAAPATAEAGPAAPAGAAGAAAGDVDMA